MQQRQRRKAIITHHLQDAPSVSPPPMSGPATAAMPYVMPMIPVYVARFAGSAEKAEIVYTPGATPEAPRPAMARPTITVVEFWATALIRLPNSKIRIDTRKLVLRGKNLNTLPHCDWNAPRVKKYTEPYHEISWILPNRSVIFGIAVATIVLIEEVSVPQMRYGD